MKFSTQEEYGLRCLLQIARRQAEGGLTIPQVSEAEGISPTHAAKLLRILRTGGFLKSARGQVGGYTLARPADRIFVSDVLAALGGRLFGADFCERHSGAESACAHSGGCSIRSLWSTVQTVVDGVLSHTTLKDLLDTERQPAPSSGLVRLPEVRDIP
jgi:Rrf2 family protein